MSHTPFLNPPTLKKTPFSLNDIESQIVILDCYLGESDKVLLIEEASQFLSGMGSYTSFKSDDEKHKHFCKQIEYIFITSKQQQKNRFMLSRRFCQALAIAACALVIAANIFGCLLIGIATAPTLVMAGVILALPGQIVTGFVMMVSQCIFEAAQRAINIEKPKLQTVINNGSTAYAAFQTIISNPPTLKKTPFSLNDIESQIVILNCYLSELDKALLMKEATQFLSGMGSYTSFKTDDEKYKHLCKQIEYIFITSKQQQKNRFMLSRRFCQALAITACTLVITASILGAILALIATAPTLVMAGIFLASQAQVSIPLVMNFANFVFEAAKQDINIEKPKLQTAINNGSAAYGALLGFFGRQNSQSTSVDESTLVDESNEKSINAYQFADFTVI